MNKKKIIIIISTFILITLVFYLFLNNINIFRLRASNIAAGNNYDRIHFLNLGGGGNCTLIESQGHFAIVDGGEQEAGASLAADDGYLKKIMGNNKLDYIIISHDHSDHAGGIPIIAEQFADSNTKFYYGIRKDDAGNVITCVTDNCTGAQRISDTLDIIKQVSGKSTQSKQLINAGLTTINVGNFKIDILNTENDTKSINVPGNDGTIEKSPIGDLNRDSLVLLVEHSNGTKTLLPADMEVDDEYRFLCKDSSQCRKYNGQNGIDYIGSIDILSMGHHGSYTSSSLEFIEKLNTPINGEKTLKNVIITKSIDKLGYSGMPYGAVDTLTYFAKNNINMYSSSFDIDEQDKDPNRRITLYNYNTLIKNTNKEAIVVNFTSNYKSYNITSSGYDIEKAKINKNFVPVDTTSYSQWEEWTIFGDTAWIYKPTNKGLYGNQLKTIGTSKYSFNDRNVALTYKFGNKNSCFHEKSIEVEVNNEKKLESYLFCASGDGTLKTNVNYTETRDGYNKGKTFNFDSSGKLINYTGWIMDIADKYLYVKTNSSILSGGSNLSVVQTGFQVIDGNKYYFAPKDEFEYYKGEMYVGWNIIKNSIYFFGGNGILKTGSWTGSYDGVTCSQSNPCNFDSSGKLYSRDITLNDVKYNCDSSGNCYKVAEIPTAEKYCKDISSNGKNQILVKAPGIGFSFRVNGSSNANSSDLFQKDVGQYKLIADKTNGYIWSDGSTTYKTIKCSIKESTKTTPTIMLSEAYGETTVGGTTTFNEKASVKGKFTVTSNNTSIATVTQASSSEIAANTYNKVTVTGIKEGTARITINFTPTDTNNYNNAEPITYEIIVSSQSDTEKPTPTISGGTTQKATSQTLTLKCSDNVGVTAYYFGTTQPTSASAITTTTDLSSLTSSSGLSKTGITNGTYYLACKDAKGNYEKTSITIRKYVVNNLLETIAGVTNTYTNANYTSTFTGTYYIKNGTSITLSSAYTTPTGSTSSNFKGYSTSYGSSTVSLNTGNPTALTNDTTTYYMWFNRNTYTVTANSGANGSTKIETVTKSNNSATANAGETTTLTVKYGDKVKVTATPNTGYGFSTWSGGYVSGSTNPITGEAITSNKTITSSFTTKTYKVTFDCNGGSGEIQEKSQIGTYGQSFTLTSETCTKSGYVQTSWNEKADGSGVSWTTTNTTNWKWTYTKDVKLYAQYEQEEIVDTEKPTPTISGGTTQKATSQTLTLKCSDNVGVAAYYFGTTQPTSASDITTKTAGDLSSLTSSSGLSKTGITNGTYYLACKDEKGNWNKTSITIRKYVVNNLLETIAGVKDTYTNANYTSESTGTYYIKNGTSITLSSAYTVPTGAVSSNFKGYSTSYGSSTVSLNTGNPTAPTNDTTTYYMWFNRNTYTVTVNGVANGSIKAQTVTQTNNSITATTTTVNLTVKYGDKVKVTATPNTGYGFSTWSGGYVSGSTNPITGGTISSNKTIAATFASNTLTFNGATLTSGTYGNAYTSNAFTGASNGTGSYTYTIKSGAPTGATINSSTRKITFTNTTPAGTYNVVVTATDTNSKQTKDATMKIVINKATPTITLSTSSGSVVSGKTLTFNEKASVKGTFTVTSNSTSIATVTQASSSEISANTNNKVTVTGKSDGQAIITVSFIPTDTNNYNNASSKTYTANIIKSAVIPTVEYCQSLTYNGSSQTLVKTAGEGYTWTEGTSKTYVGEQDVVATLSSGYRWSDNTTDTKKIKCSINKKDLTITAKEQTLTYGTSALSSVSSVTTSGLVTNDVLNSITISQTEINVGTTGKLIPSNAVIKNSDNDVTNNYNITYNQGNLTINKKNITITAKEQTIKEESEILKDVGKVTVKTLSNDDKLESITLVEDRENNKIIPSNAVIKRSNENVTDNYNITYNQGNLTIEEETVTLTLESNNTAYGVPDNQIIIVKKGSTYEVNEGKLIIKTSGTIVDEVYVILKNIKGYNTSFTGWDKTNGTLNEDTVIKANFNIEIIEYTINYNLDGGTLNKTNPENYTIETETFTLNNPSKEGYIFKGWTGSNGTTPEMNISINKGTTGNKNYKAVFEKEQEPLYTITYNLNEGEETVPNPREYTKLSKDIILSNVQKEGYIFIGWIGSNGTEPQLNVTIKSGTTGNKTYTAVFKRDISDLTITLDKSEYEYTGDYIRPIVTIKDDDYTLKENTDYEIEYTNNKEIGEGIITILGIGEYTRGKVITFKIVGQADISKITIDDNKYALIDEKTTLNEIKQLLDSENVIIKDKNGNIKSNTSLIGTQDKIEIEGKTYDVVVKGDITGNGKIEFNDVIKSYRFYRKKLTPNELELKAADLVGDNKIKFNDIIKIYRMYRGKVLD